MTPERCLQNIAGRLTNIWVGDMSTAEEQICYLLTEAGVGEIDDNKMFRMKERP